MVVVVVVVVAVAVAVAVVVVVVVVVVGVVVVVIVVVGIVGIVVVLVAEPCHHVEGGEHLVHDLQGRSSRRLSAIALLLLQLRVPADQFGLHTAFR